MRPIRFILIALALGVTMIAGQAAAQTYGIPNCSTSRGTFKTPGTLTATCNPGHCAFGPFTYTFPAAACNPHDPFTDADIYVSGYDWKLSTSSTVTPLSYWQLYLRKDSWDQATQTLTYSVIVEAENEPGSGVDGYDITADFEIIGTTGVVSRLHSYTQSCTASGSSSCSTSTLYYNAIPPGWAYAGHAMKRMLLRSSKAVLINSLAAHSHSYAQIGTRLVLTTGCTIGDSSGATDTACLIRVAGLSGTTSEVQSLVTDINVPQPPAPTYNYYSAAFSVDSPPYPPTYLCGLQRFQLDFFSDQLPIWAFSYGATSKDCNRNPSGIWTGPWRAFLGDTTYSYTNTWDKFTGEGRLWGAKLK